MYRQIAKIFSFLEEGRRKKKEGRRKKEEGRRKKVFSYLGEKEKSGFV
ncbi:hypothetical protein [Okeania sp. SIO2B3]|nr:hypothetical protein [Okeania sp. SIO2B3]